MCVWCVITHSLEINKNVRDDIDRKKIKVVLLINGFMLKHIFRMHPILTSVSSNSAPSSTLGMVVLPCDTIR